MSTANIKSVEEPHWLSSKQHTLTLQNIVAELQHQETNDLCMKPGLLQLTCINFLARLTDQETKQHTVVWGNKQVWWKWKPLTLQKHTLHEFTIETHALAVKSFYNPQKLEHPTLKDVLVRWLLTKDKWKMSRGQ